MNDHEKYAALLDAFIDGELSAQEAGEVREHLTLCADCRAYVSDALAMRDAFPDIEETVVPDGFAESVLAALPPRQSPWRTQWKKFVLPLAACLAVFLLVRGLPENRIGDMTGAAVSEETASGMDAGGEMPMMTVAAGDYSYDDADTMPPQTSELYKTSNTAESAAASKKSAPEQRSVAKNVPETKEAGEQTVTTEEAFDGVLLPVGDVAAGETNAVTEAEADTTPDTEALPANENTVSAPLPAPEPEEPEAELQSVPVYVWTIPAEAASMLKPRDRFTETKSGVWYALTAEEFDVFSRKLAGKNMEAVPGDDMPPTTFPGADYYIFVPLLAIP